MTKFDQSGTDTVTVAIVAKNERAAIAICLDSIHKQTANIEKILLVDSSTDDTIEVAKKNGDNRLEIIHGAFNVGMARFVAVQETKSSYLFFIDADAVLENNTIERLLHRMKENKATMVAPQVVNPLSIFPHAWHAGHGFVSFLPFTAVLINVNYIKNISNRYRFMSCAEDAFICREVISGSGQLFIDDQIKVCHNYPIHIKLLLKKAYWYGTGDALLFRSRTEEPLLRRASILSRSATFYFILFCAVFCLVLDYTPLLIIVVALYALLYNGMYMAKFGLLPGFYRSSIELLRSPAWSVGTFMALIIHEGELSGETNRVEFNYKDYQ